MAFADELLRVLAARGVSPGTEGEWIRTPGFSGSNPASDEQIKLLNGQRDQADINASLKCQWVENLSEVVQRLDQEGVTGPWPFRSVFWLRLHGILVDLRLEYREFFGVFDIDPAAPTAITGVQWAKDTLAAIEGVRQAFSEDELIYADYRRHTEGHPTQRAYDVRWNKKQSKVADRHGVATTDREYSVVELRAAVGRVLAAYSGEPAIAIAFARRIKVALVPLVRVMQIGAGSA